MIEILTNNAGGESSSNYWRWVAIALAIVSLGLAIGLVVSTGAGADSSLGTPNATTSEKLACAQLTALPGNGFVRSDTTAFDRLGIMLAAARLASTQDRRDKSFLATMQQIDVALNLTFSARSPQFIKSVEAARARCTT